MTIYYDFLKKPGQSKEEENPVLLPRVVSSGTVTAKRLCESIAAGTTFQQGELEGAMNARIDEMIFQLRNGYQVQFGKLGYFSLGLTSRPVTDSSTIHAQSVSFKRVNFRPSAWMKSQFQTISLKRAAQGFNHSLPSAPEDRKKALEHYLEKFSFITRYDYQSLTGLLKGKAWRELNDWMKEGFLDTSGRGTHKIYLRRKGQKKSDPAE
ncbi:MAG: DNA-binding protein [Tannerellaceae bacterium]|nr:DNA-binding protein [Tannerellaceae bacterium]